MSQQGHDLMETVSANDHALAVASPAPSAAPASPPRRDSMEDADSSLTRKRPRLDTGPQDPRAMSADSSASPPADAPPGHPQRMTIRCSQPPSSSQPHDQASDPAAPSSRMPPSEHDDAPLVESVEDLDTDASAGSPAVIAIDDDDDVEAVADIDLDYIHIDQDEDFHFRRFPFAAQVCQGNYAQAARQIGQHVGGANAVDANILPAVTEWFLTLPFRPTQWSSYLYDKAPFWEEVAVMVHKVLTRRLPFGDDFCHPHEDEDDIIYDFCQAYIKLCARIFQADALMLASQQGTFEQLPLSFRHLRNVWLILRSEKSAVFLVLEKEYRADIRGMGDRFINDFVASPTNGAKHLFALANVALKATTPVAKHNTALWTTSLLSTIGWHLARLRREDCPTDREYFHRDVLQYFRALDEDLQMASNVVDANTGKELVLVASNLLVDVCQWDPVSAADLAEEHLRLGDPGSPTTQSLDAEAADRMLRIQQDVENRPALVSNAWKFKLFRKYVVKGRMELRVVSIGTMDNALVEIWREYNGQAPNGGHPVMQFLADFLLHEQVIEYIISVDSHPQIISRSGNVVGFLAVTCRYSSYQTDLIWDTVVRSRNPGGVTALLTMFDSIVALLEAPAMCYLCTKFYDLPIESYNMEILSFFRRVSDKIRHRALDRPLEWSLDWTSTDPKARPWNVCVRFVQDTSPSLSSTELLDKMHQEACEILRGTTSILMTELPQDYEQIYSQCLAQIANRTSKATGSIRVIHILSSGGSSFERALSNRMPDAARTILEELCDFVSTQGQQHGELGFYSAALEYRLDLLRYLITRVPHSIPEGLYSDIWDHVIGRSALKNHFRDSAWGKFADAVKFQPKIKFLEELITTYIPKMEPEYFTSGLYDFVALYRFPDTGSAISTDDGEKGLLQIGGAELLWHIILTAPDGTIEDQAMYLLATRYLESTIHTVEKLEKTHVALAEKCSQELLASYSALRGQSGAPTACTEEMDLALAESASKQMELRFTRTLLFEKLMVKLIRQRPEFNRGGRADSKVDVLEPGVTVGEVIEVSFNDPTSPKNSRVSIIIGAENTVADLVNRICDTVGVTKINVFGLGQRLNTADNASSTLSESRIGNKAILMVQKAAGSETRPTALDRRGSCSVFETAVLTHFEELFKCMDSEDVISKTIFDFLAMFPVREHFMEDITLGRVSFDTLFPPGKRFQAQYAAHALLSILRDQLLKGSLNEVFLLKSIQALDHALLNTALLSKDFSDPHELQLSDALVKTLLEFLKERLGQDISSQYFSNPSQLIERLWKLTSTAREDTSADQTSVVTAAYGTMLEASLHSKPIWTAFTDRSDSVSLHQNLLLSDDRVAIRERIAQSIASVCGGDLPSTSPVTAAEVAAHFWEILSAVLPATAQQPVRSAQLFTLAEHVFRSHDERSRDEEALRTHLTSWSDLLCHYRHEEFIGRDELDPLVMGLTKLMLCCIVSLRSFKKPLNAGSLIGRIFTKYLFVPRIYEVGAEGTDSLQLPVLESSTRKEMYDLVLALAEDQNSYSMLLGLCANLAIHDDTMSTRSYSVERINEIRSNTGYVGLINPRAICYMNSLMTQLFMNVNFRKFMLNLKVADGAASQRLLSETQKLFGNLQDTFRKAADPRAFASCVKGLDGQPIDINIQMDADEFYNLLFDQWEGQMLSSELKQSFRSFYGGKTINQIKSKECEHVSEREENFFVVQCDVQGKKGLPESLQAFVEGDIMEGDNKYKCEACGGRFVDAVKRTCLKEVPDNLIFHLKRFDFDLVEMRRAKINDQFTFPDNIDVSQYNIDHLSDPSKPREADMFELVGVLVHQGTSENGHYYSYIRERPAASGESPSWVEFNDRDVDPFDPKSIPFHAYGGLCDDFSRQNKQFSAYMLFYQRKTAIEKDHQEYISSTCSGSAKVAIPAQLKEEIDADNEAFIKDYCLFDPNHSKFVRQLLSSLRTIHFDACSEDHQQEAQALHIVFEHVCGTIVHLRNLEYFDETMAQLRKTMLSCRICCQLALAWLASSTQTLTGLLLRCPHAKVRSSIRALIVDGLRFLRDEDPVLYYERDNIDLDEADQPAPIGGTLVEVVNRLQLVADESWVSSRGWDDLYLTLCQISALGTIETAVILNHQVLEFCLKVMTMHVDMQFCAAEPDLWRLVEKKKHIFNRMTELVATSLSYMDARITPPHRYAGNFDRLLYLDKTCGKMPASMVELQRLMTFDDHNRALAALDRMIETYDLTKTEAFYPGDVLRWLLTYPNNQVPVNIARTVTEGLIQLDPGFSDPYVKAALTFCEASNDVSLIHQVIDAVAKSATAVRDNGGEAHYHFFDDVYRLQNDSITSGNSDVLYKKVLAKVRMYAIPLLLCEDEAVRRHTGIHLRNLFELYKADTLLDEDVIKQKYGSLRRLVGDLSHRIMLEADAGSSKSFMEPLINATYQLLTILMALSNNDDPELEPFKSSSDERLITEFTTEVEPRLRLWSADLSTPLSTGDIYDQSDYGSESDEGPDTEP